MDKPSFEESLRALAARRLAREGHPMPEHLADYRAGTLTTEQQERIKDHLAICEDCSRLLVDLAEFERFEPRESIAPVDPKTEASWQRLRGRLQEEGGGDGEAGRDDARADEAGPILAPLRNARARSLWRRPAVPWALAAGLAVCVAGLGLRMATLQQRVGELSALRVNVGVVDLYAESDLNTRGEAPQAERVGGSSLLILHLPTDSPAFEAYEVAVVSASGKDPLFETQPVQEQDGSLTLLLSPSSLPPGSYTVRLYGLTGGQRQLLDQYLFEISPAAS